MSYPANFVVVSDHVAQVSFSRYAALLVSSVAVAGPNALAYMALAPAPLHRWTDGALLVDLDEHYLLLFTDDIASSPALRRCLVALLRHLWAGWRVHWAAHGMLDLHTYLGQPPAAEDAMRRGTRAPAPVAPDALLYAGITRGGGLVTVTDADGQTTDHATARDVPSLLAAGPALLDLLRQAPPVALPHEEVGLAAGAYLDERRREIWVWNYGTYASFDEAYIAERWSGWRVRTHADGVAGHAFLSERDPTPILLPLEEAVERLVAWFAQGVDPSGLLDLATRLPDRPLILSDTPLGSDPALLNEEERRRLITYAVRERYADSVTPREMPGRPRRARLPVRVSTSGCCAAYLVVRGGIAHLYRPAWRVPAIPRLLLGGLDAALATIAGLEPCADPACWYAEQVLLLDLDHLRILCCGGDEIARAPYLRRLFLPLVEALWPQWAVEWPTYGMADCLHYLGAEQPPAAAWPPRRGARWHPPQPFEASRWPSAFVTLRDERAGLRHGLLDHPVLQACLGDPDPLGALTAQVSGAGALPREDAPLAGGLFIDVAARTLWPWQQQCLALEDTALLERTWPGWAVRAHTAGIAAHAFLAGDDPARVCVDRASAVLALLDDVLGDGPLEGSSGAASMGAGVEGALGERQARRGTAGSASETQRSILGRWLEAQDLPLQTVVGREPVRWLTREQRSPVPIRAGHLAAEDAPPAPG